ncbi:MAG: Rrf2 family transcriptional regulator [Bacteroidia bacterium]|nr:Rrf2 family transcriptional regulator [Bacteroidia bacterium]
MVLSKTTSYALRILIYMASLEGGEVSAKILHEKLGIPNRYLRRLLTDLTNWGLIKSIQGRNGGYLITRGLEEVYLTEIIDAVEGIESLNFCILGVHDCNLIEKCAMHDLWEDVKVKMLTTFSTTSLKDLKAKGLQL